ncbi:MAG: TMEM175 family protein [Syntrophales bacterium]
MPVQRIQTLTDCIFAVAMMLMVFTFNFPSEDATFAEEDIKKFLLTQAKPVFYFGFTFMLLGFYWITNTRLSRYVRQTDTVFLFLSLVNIMFIVLLPYPNALIMKFPDSWMIQIFYSANLTLIGVSSLLMWNYCTKNRRLVDPELDQKTVDELKVEVMVEPTMALISIAAVPISPMLWRLALALIPVVLVVYEVKNRGLSVFKRSTHK